MDQVAVVALRRIRRRAIVCPETLQIVNGKQYAPLLKRS
jgi:hypothetical protein